MKEGRLRRRALGILGSVALLIVLSSVFPGADVMTRQAIARNTDSSRMTSPAILSEDDSDDSSASSFNEPREASDSVDQIYRSLRSEALVEQSREKTSNETNEDGYVTAQQTSPVGSLTVTRDLVTSGGSTHIHYSSQIELRSGPRWEATSLQGSCVIEGPQSLSASPAASLVGYDTKSGNNILLITPNIPQGDPANAACSWPPTGMDITFPATIQNGMAISSNSIDRPCFESPQGACTDHVSWNIAVPLPPEVCSQDTTTSTQSESRQDNAHVQQVSNCPPTAIAGANKIITRDDIISGKQTSVVLVGCGSFDSDNDQLKYSWSLTKPNPDLKAPTSLPNVCNPTVNIGLTPADDDFATILTYKLVVNDGKVDSGPAFVDIIVCPRHDDITPAGKCNLPKIDVRAVKVRLGVPLYHLFIIYTDEKGINYLFRAGPSGSFPHEIIQTWYSFYTSTGPDWDLDALSVTAMKGAAASGKDTCFINELSRISGAMIPYNLGGPNSNTVVKTLLTKCNVPIMKPVTSNPSPGWNHPIL